MSEYEEFIQRKQFSQMCAGFEPQALSGNLFDFQRAIVDWACRRGRAAIFADTGLGKTLMELEWAQQVADHTGKPVLIVAPLCVAHQHVREARKFGFQAMYAREQCEASGQIVLTNYEMLGWFDLQEFGGIVLDESSILKNSTGKMRNKIIADCQSVNYRLSCTATPSPNDHMELGNQAEFLGMMTQAEMLAMFFTHDGGETQKWRLKGHAKTRFWEWMACWSVCIRKPSDLGFCDDGYDLPGLTVHQHEVESHGPKEGELFVTEAQTLTERRQAQRDSIEDRVEKTKEIVLSLFCDKLAELIAAGEINGLDEETRGSASPKRAERPRVSGEAQKAGAGQRQGGKEALHAGVREAEPGEVQENAGAAGESERTAPPEVCGERSAPGENATASEGMATSQPESEEETKDQKVRTDSRSVRCIDGIGESSVPDMRLQRYDQPEVFSCDRPLSRHRESARRALHELQSGNWEVSGFARTLGSRDYILAQLPKFLIWCHVNAEQDALDKAFKGLVVSVRGTDTIAKKQQSEELWRCGPPPVFVSKPSIFGHGLNWQHCNRMAFVGLSDSFEQYYQAVRRCYRFGQERPVQVHIVTAQAEGAVKANIERKRAQSDEMSESMVAHMRGLMQTNITGAKMEKTDYMEDVAEGEGWKLHLGDCVETVSRFEADSIDYSVFSPPFASLYTYSNSDYDMGNCKDDAEFYEQFQFLIREMLRATKPGRLVSFHCMNLPTSKANHGYIGIRDFRGQMIQAFEREGWIFHSEVCIWKDPVIAMQRTKALGLLWKQLKKDSAMSRQGIPDYLVTMRKPGENPDPINHTPDEFPVDLWQKIASPVWTDINPSRTLQYREARDNDDERHICPLQLDVIERALMLWSRKGDLVFSPFAGIGSEGYCAIKMGRRFVGSELKPSYWEVARKNLHAAVLEQGDLFKGAV